MTAAATSTTAATAARSGLFGLFDRYDRLNEIAISDEFNLDIAQIAKQLFVYDKIDAPLQVLEIRVFHLIQRQAQGLSATAVTFCIDPDILGTFLRRDDFGNFYEGFMIGFYS